MLQLLDRKAMLLIRYVYVTETQLTVFFRPDIIIVGSNSSMKTLCIALYMPRSRCVFKAQPILVWIRSFLFLCLIIPVNKTCPAFSTHLKLTIRGFSTGEIIRCHRNFLTQKRFLKCEQGATG